MKNKIIAAFAASLLLLNCVGFAFTTVSASATRAAQGIELAALLPPSDLVVTVDTKRMLDEVVPQLLAGRPIMAELNKHLAEMKTKTGIDVHNFESMALAIKIKSTDPKKFDSDVVVFTRGPLNAASVIDVAKKDPKSKFRDEKIGQYTVTIFETPKPDPKAVSAAPSAAVKTAVKAIQDKTPKEFAVAALDPNTIAVGDLEMVRLALTSTEHTSPELLELLGRKPGAVANFAMRSPTGMKAFLPLSDDELGNSIDAIRYLFGSADLIAGTAYMNVTAKTMLPAQAKSIKDTLEAFQMMGKGALGASAKPEHKVLSRVINGIKLTNEGNEVAMNIQVEKADMDAAMDLLK